MRISDWSSDVCSSDLVVEALEVGHGWRKIMPIILSSRRVSPDMGAKGCKQDPAAAPPRDDCREAVFCCMERTPTHVRLGRCPCSRLDLPQPWATRRAAAHATGPRTRPTTRPQADEGGAPR